jgi:putative membrane protein
MMDVLVWFFLPGFLFQVNVFFASYYIFRAWSDGAYLSTFYYDVGEEYLLTRGGVIGKRQVQVPFEKIQDVNMEMGVVARLFGLWTVSVDTAAESLSGAHIPGLSHSDAEGLRQLILSRIPKKSVK